MGKDLTLVTNTIFVCNGGSCKKQGAEENVRELRCSIKMAGLHETTHTVRTLCLGQCENAPVVFMQPENVWYKRMTAEALEQLVQDKLMKNKVLSEHELYREGWGEMRPFKWIDPKTRSDFSYYHDEIVGNVYGAAIYPWEFNVYPLLKELFIVYRSETDIYYKDQLLSSTDFKVSYTAGKVIIEGDIVMESFSIVTSALKESPDFLFKISKIRLYRDEQRGINGLYMGNSNEGVFLRAEWRATNNLWDHLVNNYVNISA